MIFAYFMGKKKRQNARPTTASDPAMPCCQTILAHAATGMTSAARWRCRRYDGLAPLELFRYVGDAMRKDLPRKVSAAGPPRKAAAVDGKFSSVSKPDAARIASAVAR
jgi:hypothetical protein